jgi:hypothetical protein
VKSNIYLTDNKSYGGDTWMLGVHKAQQDLYNTVISQPFVNKFEVLPDNFNEPFINLNSWRNMVIGDYFRDKFFYRSWSEFLSEHYKYEIPKTYKWINIDKIDVETNNKIVIHRSLHRHNQLFDWKRMIDSIDEEIIFVTCSNKEWEQFNFKQDKVKLKFVSTIDEMAIAINSCKYFIGNQSSPFALACALDVNRLVELAPEPSMFYMKENKYSENISWYLNDNKKYFNQTSIIKI